MRQPSCIFQRESRSFSDWTVGLVPTLGRNVYSWVVLLKLTGWGVPKVLWRLIWPQLSSSMFVKLRMSQVRSAQTHLMGMCCDKWMSRRLIQGSRPPLRGEIDPRRIGEIGVERQRDVCRAGLLKLERQAGVPRALLRWLAGARRGCRS